MYCMTEGRQTDRQPDRQRDRQTDRQTDRYFIDRQKVNPDLIVREIIERYVHCHKNTGYYDNINGCYLK